MSGRNRSAVFMDRDGVLNRAIVRDGRPFAPRSLAELEIDPAAAGCCAALRAAGFTLLVVTNQPDVARGTLSRAEAEAMNAAVRQRLKLDDMLVCYHDDNDGCDCRKPKPGLILSAARARSIDLSRSFMVGDRWKDVEAGRRAGCRTVFVDANYQEPRPPVCDFIAINFREAADWILAQSRVAPHTGQPSDLA